MQFLFETITIENGIMSYYRMYKTGPGSYYAEGMCGEKDFRLTCVGDDWIAEKPGTENQADQIGEELIRKQGRTNSAN